MPEPPDASGTLVNDALKLKPEGSSLFDIRPSIDKRTAEVTLCGTPDMHRQAFRNQRRFLLPVCEYADLPRYTDTKIAVTKPGRTERQDTGWRVTVKLGINFGRSACR